MGNKFFAERKNYFRYGETDITLDVTDFDKITVTYCETSKELYVTGQLTFDQAKKLLTT